MSAPGLAARLAAAELLTGVVAEGQMLSEQAARLEKLSPVDRARAQSLALSVLRHRDALDARLDGLLRKPPPVKVKQILRVAAWELLADGVPAHAAVDGAVRAAKATQKTAPLAKLVNAIARGISRDETGWHPELQRLPKGLTTGLTKVYGAETLAAMEAVFQSPAPVDLSFKGEVTTDLPGEMLPTGSRRLHDPGQISALPGYETGDWWVQDAAAALPVKMLGDVKGLRVLDLCAAPGGKTMQLAALGAEVTALDISRPRMKLLEANLKRTGLPAEIVIADALKWQPKTPFDIVLLDAPCSATGTIRRHPDLPLVREGKDLAPLLALQSDLIKRALGFLKPDGRLLYCTCSLLPVEGERQIAGRTVVPPAEIPGLPADWITDNMLRTRPDFWAETGGMDGFFAAILTP